MAASRWRPVVVTIVVAGALAGIGGSAGVALGGVASVVAEHHSEGPHSGDRDHADIPDGRVLPPPPGSPR